MTTQALTPTGYTASRGFRIAPGRIAHGRRHPFPYGWRRSGCNAICALTVAIVAVFAAQPAPAGERVPRILALGDSLTAGYGLPEEEAFTTRLQSALIASGIPATVIDGGVSGDTTAGGLARLDWLLADGPDAAIVELGSNDGLRGLDPELTYRNLDRIIRRLKASGVQVLLTGMLAPPNLGDDYGRAFNTLFPRLADKHDILFYPFFLDGVAADPDLNQADGIHPNAEGVGAIVRGILPLVRRLVDLTE